MTVQQRRRREALSDSTTGPAQIAEAPTTKVTAWDTRRQQQPATTRGTAVVTQDSDDDEVASGGSGAESYDYSYDETPKKKKKNHSTEQQKKRRTGIALKTNPKRPKTGSLTLPSARLVTPERKPQTNKPTASRSKKAKAAAAPEKDLPAWFPEFENFLLSVPHGPKTKVASPSNARSVLRQVKKLVTGEGIGYVQWPRNVTFCANRVVTLDDDFRVLSVEAKQYEDQYGRDTGNGWLVRHPLKKLLLFQNYQKRLQDPQQDQQRRY